MSVSAVIVSYFTGRAELERCVSSVSSQCDDIILVDNGNPTEVTEWLAADDRVTHIQAQGNVGFSRGCNLGAKAARHNYLFFLNPDTELNKGCVAALKRAAKGADEPRLFGARLLDVSGQEQRGSRRETLTPMRFFTGIAQHDLPSPASPQPVEAVSGAALFMSRATFDRLSGFDGRYFLHVEDLDICKRCHDLGGAVIHVPEAEVVHIGATSDAPNWVVETHKAMGFRSYFKAHYPRVYHFAWPAMSLALRLRNRRS